MNILLFGANGQVGWELQRALSPLGTVRACDVADVDMADVSALAAFVAQAAPDIIVNAAAYTAVDKAESDAEHARLLNAEAVRVLAQAAKARGIWFIHYSTDYVFDGQKQGRYTEEDSPNPQSVYGRTKWEGERAIAESGCSHLIFRTSWVYASRGQNFIRTMLRLAQERDSLRVVGDQHGAPTSAELLADVTALAIHRLRHDAAFAAQASGLYHLVASGETTWHGFAQHIIGYAAARGMALRVAPEAVASIPSAEYPTPATRPANSRLETQKLQALLGITLPDWRIHADRALAELMEHTA